MAEFVSHKAGLAFEVGDDHGRIIVDGHDTDGAYSLLDWTIGAGEKSGPEATRDYGMHMHGECEETFLIKSGALEFVLGTEIIHMTAGDFVRVPRNTQHGYENVSGAPVEMLVGFHPAGFEALFIKYRSDQPTQPLPGFIEEGMADYASTFGLPNPSR